MDTIARREFVAGAAMTAALGGALGSSVRAAARQPGADDPGAGHRGACLIASANGLVSVREAGRLMADGADPCDAVVAGIRIVEDDPNDMSVGYGGLPNEEGIVQLDASIMDGRVHRAGAVGALERIKNPAAVALEVLRRTDHVMLVGDGALRFARRLGFQEQDLLTDAAREAWLKWRGSLNKDDKWLDEDQQIKAQSGRRADATNPHTSGHGPVIPDSSIPYTTGTVHVSCRTESGDLVACTSTSGLSWKLPGRLGDSPIVGAGMYCDNAIGSAGATGRGEAVIQVCGAFAIVEQMDRGLSPREACLAVLKRIADRTREKRLLDERGRPAFNVTMYAARKDGAYGSASMWKGASFAVNDGRDSRIEACAWLFER